MKGWITINLSGRKGQEEVSQGQWALQEKEAKREEVGGGEKEGRKGWKERGTELTQGISNQRGTIMYV